MLTKYVYPKCANTFRNWCLSNSKYEKIYYEIGQPVPFDVTLRDGLQALPKDKTDILTTNDKLKMYYNIVFNHHPLNIEIGSIVSEKVLPVFKDTIELFNKINYTQKQTLDEVQNKYILVPNIKNMYKIIDNPLINHFSFITSMSNSFQLKNTKMSLEESDEDIKSMLHELDNNKYRTLSPVVKLYVSCVNECPIEGKIEHDVILNRLLKLDNMENISNICLSDTCGTLSVDDFEYIVNACNYFDIIPLHKISLHLHVKKGREDEVEKIIHRALDYKIINFDVSALDSGGCSVTLNKNMIAPNLSYELYYKSLCNYIMQKS